MSLPNLTLLIAVARDERGQDLIEYALLTAFIGFAGAAAWDLVGGSIAAAYASWDGSINDLWVPPDPG